MRTFGYTETSFMLEPGGTDIDFLSKIHGVVVIKYSATTFKIMALKGSGGLTQAIRALKAIMDKDKQNNA